MQKDFHHINRDNYRVTENSHRVNLRSHMANKDNYERRSFLMQEQKRGQEQK